MKATAGSAPRNVTTTLRRTFYDRLHLLSAGDRQDREEEAALVAFVREHGLANRRVLEEGSGRGHFQHLSAGWVGHDYSTTAAGFASRPFAADVFDAVWSIAVLERGPEPEVALREIPRVLKPGGVAYLAPAWHCRSWAAEGLTVRPLADLTWRQCLTKLSIPVRDSLVLRGLGALPVRFVAEVASAVRRGPRSFHYKRLRPNYETDWCAAADACNSMDPHDTLLWFLSRGCCSPSHRSLLRRCRVRHGGIIIRTADRAGRGRRGAP